MYKEIDSTSIRKLLDVGEQYTVDALITYGSHPKQSTEKLFKEKVQKLFPNAISEDSFQGFFQDVHSYKIDSKRIWFCVTYGGAMTSEIIHTACLLGAKKILHGGSCGALQEVLSIGDIFLPISSDANESCTRMYQRNNRTVHIADESLRETLASNIDSDTASGKMLSIQSMLAETRKDVDSWSQSGYKAVDLEVATVFAVAKHFDVDAAAILYIADNLITEDLIHTSSDEQRSLRRQSKQSIIQALLKTACI